MIYFVNEDINYLGPNAQFALYNTMSLEQGIFLAVYAVLAYPIYLGNKKLTGWLVDRLLFSPREFKDE